MAQNGQKSYRVFLGAPPASALNSEAPYHWQTFSSGSLLSQPASTKIISRTESFFLPPATLEAASRRISLIYQNAIFDQSVEDEDQSLREDSIRREGSTLISWPPTEPQEQNDRNEGPTFLLTSQEEISKVNSTTGFGLLDSTRYETQGETQSYGNYSDSSSIARFPTFHFNIQALTPLSYKIPPHTRSVKVNALLAVLEVEGPDKIRIKKGPDAGKEVGILKMILGDELGNVAKLTAWREVADEWGGINDEPGTKRGDIIHLENVLMACEQGMSPTLTASPNLKSKMTICYRTLPYTHEDGRLRPDLRLGDSDPCVRRVAAVVQWFENMIGLPGR
ncbi:hypothetical protein CC2G_000188 [Coprinopsis cinerea AmutBmut pab1-1]|nr:hypothetical protein CC2G_000188 [Coprinopsis cinerea AmutBmut pab1-1]